MVRGPFKLTYIVYDHDDGIWGWLMALMSLSPVFFVAIICASILIRRDMHSVFLLLEMVVIPNNALYHDYYDYYNYFYREYSAKNDQVEYNQLMECLPITPSSCLAFVYIFLCGYIGSRVHLHSFIQNIAAIVILWIAWFFVVYGRLYLGEHSFEQVFVGVLVGFLYGWIWYKFDDQVLRKYYQTIADSPLFRWFQFKDYSDIQNPLEQERILSKQVCLKQD